MGRRQTVPVQRVTRVKLVEVPERWRVIGRFGPCSELWYTTDTAGKLRRRGTVTPEERRRAQQEVEDALAHINSHNQERLLRLAQHLAQHKLLSQLYIGRDDPEPYCLCTDLN